MQIQLMNKEYERKLRQVEQGRQQQQHQQNYQQRREFVQTSGDIAPQSVPTERPPPVVLEETKRQLQQEEGNLVNWLTTERGYPTFTPRIDTSGCRNRFSEKTNTQ